MRRVSMVRLCLVTLICVSLLLPASNAGAQQAAGIAGAVRDSSGAVLPGVTVEARSAALIEGVRTVFTDGEGRYNLVDLRPGTYTVTFVLPGFSTFVRDGIQVSTGFTATVNVDMQVGSLEETVTVTGEAPLVDTQNVLKQTRATDELLDVLPTSTKSVNTLVALTPGFSGITSPSDIYSTAVGSGGGFQGKGGTKLFMDGMGVEWASGNIAYQPNLAIVEEVVLQTSGMTAEANAEGALTNMVPKEGGNTFSGSLFGLYSNDSLQGENLTDDLRARGLETVGQTLKVYDGTATLGGPFKRDRLWFFTAIRWYGNAHQDAGIFWNATQGTPFYTPDFSRPSDRYQWYESKAVRLTWQAQEKHKINFLFDHQRSCNCRFRPPGNTQAARLDAPEAAHSYMMKPDLFQGTWNWPVTSRMLVDAGVGAAIANWPQFRNPGVTFDDISITELTTGMPYNSRASYNHRKYVPRYTQRFSVSYVTGSHNFKTGFQLEEATDDQETHVNQNVNYRFRDAVPVTIVQYATPYRIVSKTKADLGIYAQDQWTVERLTINMGLRFDYFNGYVPAQDLPATPNGWVPARSFPEVKGVPDWTDLNPRFGASYDLFGDGETALKFSLGRFVVKTGTAIAAANNPVQTSVNTVTRSWNDADRDYVPDCDLGTFDANGECGALSNRNFGGTRITSRWADDVLAGFGVRPFLWDMSAEVQHQLVRGVSLTAGYYRNWYGNFRVTDNLAVSPDDYDPYCVVAPVDPRLPGGGGFEVCGLYDISPARFGQVDELIAQASDYGTQSQGSDFISGNFNARLGVAQLGGGFSTGRTVDDQCFVVDSPQQLLHCRVVKPFGAQTDFKLHGSYALPAGFVVSGVLQNMPGPETQAQYAAGGTEIARSLGRSLAGGARTATVPLVAPQTIFDGRISRLDLRLTKLLGLGPRLRLQTNVDLYNILNASDILVVNHTYGSEWRKPNAVLDARMIQFSARLAF